MSYRVEKYCPQSRKWRELQPVTCAQAAAALIEQLRDLGDVSKAADYRFVAVEERRVST